MVIARYNNDIVTMPLSKSNLSTALSKFSSSDSFVPFVLNVLTDGTTFKFVGKPVKV